MNVGHSHKVGRANVGTGEYAHEWALILRDEIGRHDVSIADDPRLTEHGRELLRALGVTIEVEATA